jgi:hypothetical protein
LTDEVKPCYFDAYIVLWEQYNGHLGRPTVFQVEPTFNVLDRRLSCGSFRFELVPACFGVASPIQYVLVHKVGNVGVFEDFQEFRFDKIRDGVLDATLLGQGIYICKRTSFKPL